MLSSPIRRRITPPTGATSEKELKIVNESRTANSAYVINGSPLGGPVPNIRANARSFAMHVDMFTAVVAANTGYSGFTEFSRQTVSVMFADMYVAEYTWIVVGTNCSPRW